MSAEATPDVSAVAAEPERTPKTRGKNVVKSQRDGLAKRLRFGPDTRAGRSVSEDDLALIEQAIKAQGASLKTAARLVGHGPEAIEVALDESPYWRQRIYKARAEQIAKVEDATFKAATTVDDHGRYDVRAQVFYLTNRAPESWRQRVEQVVETRPDKVRDAQKRIPPELMARLKGMVQDALLGRGEIIDVTPPPVEGAGEIIEEIPE